MSAIWALLHPDGAPVEAAHLERMSAALKALGQDRVDAWREGPAGLGHRLMAFTLEDRFEQQPLVSANGRLVLVFDGRLDNRPELAAALQLKPAAARLWPDSAYVLRAFETWGEACPQHLVGGLAFMVWDRQRRRLFAAITPSGSCALFYHQGPNTLALASLPHGLLALPWIPRRLNQAKLEGYLLRSGGERDRTATFWEGIHRLPGGHTLAAEDGALEVRPYWLPEAIPELRLKRDEDYVEALNALFERVVADHLRSLTPVAVMMSGGLDSTAVAAVAAPLLQARGETLLSLTSVPEPGAPALGVPPRRVADESACVRAVAALYPNLEPEFLPTSGLCFLDGLDEYFDHHLTPPVAIANHVWLDAILQTARDRGRRVILTGEAGNHGLSWAGNGVIAYHLRRSAWGAAWREARALSRHGQRYSPWRALLAHGLWPLLPETTAARLARLRARPDPFLYTPIRSGYAAAHGLDLSRAQGASGGRSALGRRRTRIGGTTHHVPAWRSRHGVDARDPTGDQRIVEFCLSTPHDQFQRDGQPRWLIRRAMAGRLPPEVLDARERGVQGADWLSRLRRRRDEAAAVLARLRANELARDLLDLDRLARLIETWPEPPPDPSAGDHTADEYGAAQLALTAGRFILWAGGAT